MDFKEIGLNGVYWIYLVQDGENDNQYSGSMKCWYFLGLSSNQKFLTKALCSIQLVNPVFVVMISVLKYSSRNKCSRF